LCQKVVLLPWLWSLIPLALFDLLGHILLQ
jgi:hypothetical protein